MSIYYLARHLTAFISLEHPGSSRKQFSREISSSWRHVAVQREHGGFAPRFRLYLKEKALSLNQVTVLVARGSLARAPLAWPPMQRLNASPRAKRRAQGHRGPLFVFVYSSTVKRGSLKNIRSLTVVYIKQD